MQIPESAIIRVTEEVWSSTLGLSLTPGARGTTATDPALVGRILISGAWRGAVTLRSAEPLAQRAAAILNDVPAADATLEMVKDTLGELTNIIAGNLKGLMPGLTQLSLPAVARGDERAALAAFETEETKLLGQAALACDGQPLQVQVWQWA